MDFDVESEFTRPILEAVNLVKQDERDLWPCKGKFYSYNETVNHDSANREIIDATTPFNGKNDDVTRLCTSYRTLLHRKIEALKVAFGNHENSLQNKINSSTDEIIMELIILSKFNNINLVHHHAVWLDETTLNLEIILPRLYNFYDIISGYRLKKKNAYMPFNITAPVIRQCCDGLSYLHSRGIIHRNISSNTIFLTRGGTVKLGGFGYVKSIVSDSAMRNCKSPKGKKSFMCGKKQFNLNTFSPLDAMAYNFKSDIWSLGVILIQTVSYYPFEKFQQLPETFALGMMENEKGFSDYLEDYFQLRARLNYACNGNGLEKLLNDHILVQNENERLSADMLKDYLIKNKWCNSNISVDKKKIVEDLIKIVDITNRCKLGSFGPNFEMFLSPYDKDTKYQVNGNHFDLSGTKLKIKLILQNYIEHICNITCNDDKDVWKVLFELKEKGIFTAVDVLKIFTSIQENIRDIICKLRNDNDWTDIITSSSRVKNYKQNDVIIEVSAHYN
uniref:Protein kinase domain-containing protein n=1 Tax=Parastrongyloides trichosuri TaxID=131310 RepID=A0A0N4ZXG1_PARTI